QGWGHLDAVAPLAVARRRNGARLLHALVQRPGAVEREPRAGDAADGDPPHQADVRAQGAGDQFGEGGSALSAGRRDRPRPVGANSRRHDLRRGESGQPADDLRRQRDARFRDEPPRPRDASVLGDDDDVAGEPAVAAAAGVLHPGRAQSARRGELVPEHRRRHRVEGRARDVDLRDAAGVRRSVRIDGACARRQHRGGLAPAPQPRADQGAGAQGAQGDRAARAWRRVLRLHHEVSAREIGRRRGSGVAVGGNRAADRVRPGHGQAGHDEARYDQTRYDQTGFAAQRRGAAQHRDDARRSGTGRARNAGRAGGGSAAGRPASRGDQHAAAAGAVALRGAGAGARQLGRQRRQLRDDGRDDPPAGRAALAQSVRRGDPEEVFARRGLHRVRDRRGADRAALSARRRGARHRRELSHLRDLLRLVDDGRIVRRQEPHLAGAGDVGRQRAVSAHRPRVRLADGARTGDRPRRRRGRDGRCHARLVRPAAPARRIARRNASRVVSMRIFRPLDRYVFAEFWKIFSVTALGLPILVVVIDLTENVDKYLNRHIPTPDIALSYVYWIPDSMFMVLPAAVLFATVFSIGALSRHSEVTAAKASGISFYRLVSPILLGALFATGLDLALGEVLPHTNQRRSELLQEDKALVGSNRFNFAFAGENGRVYKAYELRTDSGRILNLQIERKGKGIAYPTYLISADTALYDPRRGNWALRRGDLTVIGDT